MTRVRVVIVDDDAKMCVTLADLLTTDPGLQVVGSAADVEEAAAVCAVHEPDVVVVDANVPGGGGAEVTRLLRRRRRSIRVVALSAHEDRATVREMLPAGAVGYVRKGSSAEEIIAAVHRVAGGLALSPADSAERVHELGVRPRHEQEASRLHEPERARFLTAVTAEPRVVFQPVVDLRDGSILGVEALAQFDTCPPQPTDVCFAEGKQFGLGQALERAALSAAITVLDRLPRAALLGVNLAPGTIVAPGFWDDIPTEVLGRLVIELTEHAAVDDYDQLATVLAPLRKHGAQVAVDDAGFASLRHIVLLDADFIKIDASLTRNLSRHPYRRALASALVSFAAETDAAVVAQGVEHEEDLGALTRLGVRYAQGSLLGRPCEPDRLDLTARSPATVALPSTPPTQPERPPSVERLLRRLLHVSTPEDAVAELVGFVHDAGGRVVAATLQRSDVVPVDLSLGVLNEPILPAAAQGSTARAILDEHLPALVEDARAVIARLDHARSMSRAAVIDPLTGLLNRRAAGPALHQGAVGDAVALLDLDHFKQINDNHGHSTGDAVLRVFGDTLRHSLREADTCGRFGGEEFVVILPATTLPAATKIIERIAQRWRAQRPLPVTFSAGVAAIDERGAEAALAAADAALYRAKNAGRDRIETSGTSVADAT